MAILDFLRTGIFDRKHFLEGLALYPMALKLGGLGALVVGLAYGLALVLIDRFRPQLLYAVRTSTRVVKAIVFPLAFTALLGSSGSLIKLLVLPTLPGRPGRNIAGFQVLGDAAFFAAPTLLCAVLFTYWVLPRLPGQAFLGLRARGADGKVREPRADHVPEEQQAGQRD
jgi:hypothetical protein